MERRHFLKVAFGFAAAAAGAATLAASAEAAPLAPHPLDQDGRLPAGNQQAHPAVTTADEVNRLKPEEIRWGRHWHHRHWHRHWGWRRHRHWGWRRHHHWGWRHRWHRRRYW